LAELQPWRGFVKALVGAGGTAARPTFASSTATVATVSTGLQFSAALSSGADVVASPTFAYGWAPSSTVLNLVGDQPATVSGTTVSATWDKSVLALTQGSNTAVAYLSLGVTAQGEFAATIPLSYVAPGQGAQYATRRLVFNAQSQ